MRSSSRWTWTIATRASALAVRLASALRNTALPGLSIRGGTDWHEVGGMTEEYAVLDLFCGLGGFSQAFADSDRWTVTTVDIEDRFDPNICADVFDLRPSDFEEEFDVILAGPPCTQFSIAASRFERFDGAIPQTPDARDALALVYHTVGLIESLTPTYWFLENPVGKLRKAWRDPAGTVTQCQYGRAHQKPTDLWGRHPSAFQYRTCGPGEDCHTASPRGFDSDDSTDHVRDPAERAKVPAGLSESIRQSCEQALDGEAPEQSTLAEATE